MSIADIIRINTVIDQRDAALARAEAAESECAELNDALDAMRMTADEVQARQRGRVQAGAWAQAAAAVQAATECPPNCIDCWAKRHEGQGHNVSWRRSGPPRAKCHSCDETYRDVNP